MLNLYDEIRKLRSTVKADLRRRNEYKTLNAMLRIMMNKTKVEWIQEQFNYINEDMSRYRSNKRAYKSSIMLTESNHKNMMIIFDKNDKHWRTITD